MVNMTIKCSHGHLKTLKMTFIFFLPVSEIDNKQKIAIIAAFVQ